MTTRAFDPLAATYDATFSDTRLGQLLRRAVWRRVDRLVQPGQRILDLGCGTGEDAIHLADLGAIVTAVDVAPQMVAATQAKTASLSARVAVHTADLERLDAEPACAGPFDGVISNFGAVNCAADLDAVLAGVAARLRVGGFAALCVMGPLVPWEWLWMVATGRPGHATRRLRRGGVEWRGVRVRYPSIRRLRRACPADLRLCRVSGIGVLLPPTYAEAWIGRRPRLLHLLDRVERRLEATPPLPWFADHYLAELEKV